MLRERKMNFKYVAQLSCVLGCLITNGLAVKRAIRDYPRPHNNCYWVVQGRLLAGEYPSRPDSSAARAKIACYLNANITFFLDLTQEGELEPYTFLLQEEADKRGINVEYRRMPIRDMSVPTKDFMTDILSMINNAMAKGHNVYFHCWGGIGRTGTVTGCYLVQKGLTGDEALKQLAASWKTVAKSKLHPLSPQTSVQREFVRNYAKR